MWKKLTLFWSITSTMATRRPFKGPAEHFAMRPVCTNLWKGYRKRNKKHTLLLLLPRNNRKNLHIFVMLWNEMLSSPAESSKHVVHALRSFFDTLSAVKRAGSLAHSGLSIVFHTFACIIYTNFTLFYVFFNAASFAHIFLKDLQHFSTHFHKFSRRKNWKHFLPWLLTGKKEM